MIYSYSPIPNQKQPPPPTPERTILNSLLFLDISVLPDVEYDNRCLMQTLDSDIGRISSAISFPASVPRSNFNPVPAFLSLGLNVF